MTLLGFHRFLISAGIAFCFGFAAWEAWAWRDSRATSALLLAVTFVVLGTGLVIYLRKLNRFLGYEREDRSL